MTGLRLFCVLTVEVQFECEEWGECEITMATRDSCKACRFKKCCFLGMDITDLEEQGKVHSKMNFNFFPFLMSENNSFILV